MLNRIESSVLESNENKCSRARSDIETWKIIVLNRMKSSEIELNQVMSNPKYLICLLWTLWHKTWNTSFSSSSALHSRKFLYFIWLSALDILSSSLFARVTVDPREAVFRFLLFSCGMPLRSAVLCTVTKAKSEKYDSRKRPPCLTPETGPCGSCVLGVGL